MTRCSESKIEELIKEVKTQGISLTANMKRTLHFLIHSISPISSKELDEHLMANSSTSFRIINKLQAAKIIVEIDMGEGFKRYELKPKNHHHHYIRCESCHNLEAIHHCQIQKLEDQCKSLGFTNIKHKIEFFGICSNCH